MLPVSVYESPKAKIFEKGSFAEDEGGNEMSMKKNKKRKTV